MPAERYMTKEKANIEIYGRADSESPALVQIKDISKTGACLQQDRSGPRLRTGDLLRVIIRLENLQKEHQVNAQVVWTHGTRSGIQFLTSDQVVEKMLFRGRIDGT